MVADSSATSVLDRPEQTPRIIAKMCCVLARIKPMTPELRHKLANFIQMFLQSLQLLLHDLHVLLLCYCNAYWCRDRFSRLSVRLLATRLAFMDIPYDIVASIDNGRPGR